MKNKKNISLISVIIYGSLTAILPFGLVAAAIYLPLLAICGITALILVIKHFVNALKNREDCVALAASACKTKLWLIPAVVLTLILAVALAGSFGTVADQYFNDSSAVSEGTVPEVSKLVSDPLIYLAEFLKIFSGFIVLAAILAAIIVLPLLTYPSALLSNLICIAAVINAARKSKRGMIFNVVILILQVIPFLDLIMSAVLYFRLKRLFPPVTAESDTTGNTPH